MQADGACPCIRWEFFGQECTKVHQGWMAKTVIQVVERALHVFQISRFAVSSPKPNPQPSHPAMPLTAMYGKRCGNIFWGQMRGRILVSSKACGADLGWHIAPGIFNQ